MFNVTSDLLTLTALNGNRLPPSLHVPHAVLCFAGYSVSIAPICSSPGRGLSAVSHRLRPRHSDYCPTGFVTSLFVLRRLENVSLSSARKGGADDLF